MSSLVSDNNIPIRDLPANDRTREVAEAFTGVYNDEPTFYIRVPGR